MDTKRLPLSLLVALGLAPGGCDELGCKPCLNIAEPDPTPDSKGTPADTKGTPSDTKGTPPDTKGDPDMHPCLMVPVDPSGVEPCLEVPPCLSPPPETKTGPCLDVEACLMPRVDPSPKCLSAIPVPKGKASDGGMARGDVIDRLLQGDVLPPDVATRLRDRSEDA